MGISVAAMTGGSEVASARFRVRQYIRFLELSGIFVREFEARFGAFPPASKWVRPAWGVCSLAARIPAILKSYNYDIVLFQRELISTLVTLELLSKAPRILDVDDAIWLPMGDGRARRFAKLMDMVICGNQFLADYFSSAGAPVVVVPTAVDVDRFQPIEKHEDHEVIIGWSGSSSAFQELETIQSALATILKSNSNTKFHVLADQAPMLAKLPPNQVLFTKWSPEVELSALQRMDIGIMPLRDSAWNRGKCSYKMLLYMACGLPVVVSPVGMNIDVMSRDQFGFQAISIDDWIQSLETLVRNRELRCNYGRSARQVVTEHFSIQAVGPRLAKLLSQLRH
jgi:glycosyltransferase involved in cell wall biosynthesis